MRKFLSSKIHRATITEANIDYQGSITIPPSLLAASGISVHEAVWVWNITNGSRFETYIIPGIDAPSEDDRAPICVNGAAARLVTAGDIIIVAAFCFLSAAEIDSHEPRVVFVNDKNKCIKIEKEKAFSVAR